MVESVSQVPQESCERTTREQIEQRQHVAGLLVEETGERSRIHARHGNKRASTEHDQCSNKEQDPYFKLLQLATSIGSICWINLWALCHIFVVFT